MIGIFGYNLSTGDVVGILIILLVAEFIIILKNWEILTEMGIKNLWKVMFLLSVLQLCGVMLWIFL